MCDITHSYVRISIRYAQATVSRIDTIKGSDAEYSLFDRALLQKRPTILSILLVAATPYSYRSNDFFFSFAPTRPIVHMIMRVTYSLIRVTRLVHMRDMIRCYICVTRLVQMRDTTRPFV